jgi:DNA polymerase-3 subunit gamma/tau
MNQCDVNYRQSSNKRLLVELTLIEIAQITQPDDGVSAGRRPKRLKSLFKNLIQQSQPKSAAPQVVAAETPVSQPNPKNPITQNTPNAQSTPSSQNTPTNQPSPAKAPNPAAKGTSLNKIGFSWTKLRKDGKLSKVNFTDGLADGKDGQSNDQLFSQEDLELQWMSMCNRMSDNQPQLIGIATRMKNMNPQITEFPQVEVTVENELIKQDMEAIYKSILKTLQLHLRNQQITFTILVSDQKDQTKKHLSRREQFEEMSIINPAVAKLQQELELELA